MAHLPEEMASESLLRRLGRGAWCGLYAGAVAGTLSMFLFVFLQTDSTAAQKWQFSALVLGGCLGAFVGNWLLARRLRPYGLAAVLGAIVIVGALELLLYLLIDPTSSGLGSPLLFGLLFGALPGAVVGAICCGVLGALPVAVVDSLAPWGWLIAGSVGALILLWIVARNLMENGQVGEWQVGAVFALGFALAGWIAQNEYLRLRPLAQH